MPRFKRSVMKAKKRKDSFAGPLTALVIFALAMALLEAAVVVYLRYIAYPDGFSFPLRAFPDDLLTTELWRELATLLMLLGIAWMFGRSWTSRLAGFLMAFAVWDLGYYLFLWLLLDWPSSLLTWDLLFLIPAPWTGPVLAPVIHSLTMIAMGAGLMSRAAMQKKDARAFWIFNLIGSLIAIATYLWPWTAHMLETYPLERILSMEHDVVFSAHALNFVPTAFPWIPFLIGESLFVLAVLRVYRR
ncbi:MAG: hypothetical protein IH599_01070 [Bacteroidales bacterium]|nr:hypothetical protein [Bacteroidales bacterium]